MEKKDAPGESEAVSAASSDPTAELLFPFRPSHHPQEPLLGALPQRPAVKTPASTAGDRVSIPGGELRFHVLPHAHPPPQKKISLGAHPNLQERKTKNSSQVTTLQNHHTKQKQYYGYSTGKEDKILVAKIKQTLPEANQGAIFGGGLAVSPHGARSEAQVVTPLQGACRLPPCSVGEQRPGLLSLLLTQLRVGFVLLLGHCLSPCSRVIPSLNFQLSKLCLCPSY